MDDEFWMWRAEQLSLKSPDPSTKVGCVIVRPYECATSYEVSTGWNKFPRGIDDDYRWYERDEKYKLVVHAEMVAMLKCPGRIIGCTLYVWPLPICDRCAAHAIEAGITRIICGALQNDRWEKQAQLAQQFCNEACVDYARR